MFTGIIEEVGTIQKIGKDTLCVRAKTVLEGTRIGDSIAVNGCCLTVTSLEGGCFTADVMPETFRRTNLGTLQIGSPVNLERAMAADGRFGGHIVSGHIDGCGKIMSIRPEGNAVWVQIETPDAVLRYIVEKGSIAIDGISLTVAKVDRNSFSVSVIPHTGSETTLLGKRPGDAVNLENDIVAKYVERLMQPVKTESRITMEFLRENGF